MKKQKQYSLKFLNDSLRDNYLIEYISNYIEQAKIMEKMKTDFYRSSKN